MVDIFLLSFYLLAKYQPFVSPLYKRISRTTAHPPLTMKHTEIKGSKTARTHVLIDLY